MTAEHKTDRRIRSFVRREGRLTPGQQRAMDELFPRYGVAASDQQLDFAALFGREAPLILEIGYGNGNTLLHLAETHPENDYMGIEVHRPGVGRLLQGIEKRGLTNLRTMCADAVEVLRNQVPDNSLGGVLLFFPDPWHKKRHHKRRQVQPDWARLVHGKLKPGGRLHMATDWENYALHMLDVMRHPPGFRNLSKTGDFVLRPEYRPLTKFEQRGHRLGHGVWDLMFERL